MAVNQIPKKRGGEAKVLTIGIAADGNSRIYERLAANDPATGTNRKERPKRITIDFGEEGEVLSIRNEWLIHDEYPTGGLVKNQVPTPFTFYTKKADRLSFVQKFIGILYSMANGNNAKKGFAAFPVFYPENVLNEDGTVKHYAGQLAQYTEEEMNEPPILEGPGSYGYEDLPADENPLNP